MGTEWNEKWHYVNGYSCRKLCCILPKEMRLSKSEFQCLGVTNVMSTEPTDIRVPFHSSFKSSFLSTKYISLRANLPPRSFSEMAPRYSHMLSKLYINYPQVLKLTHSQSHLLQLKPFTQYQFSIYLVPINCWMARGGVDSKLGQGFYTWPALRESNPRRPWSRVQRLNHLVMRSKTNFLTVHSSTISACKWPDSTHSVWAITGRLHKQYKLIIMSVL